eukprot:15325736-Ditylum_brightwellii.AAC.1
MDKTAYVRERETLVNSNSVGRVILGSTWLYRRKRSLLQQICIERVHNSFNVIRVVDSYPTLSDISGWYRDNSAIVFPELISDMMLYTGSTFQPPSWPHLLKCCTILNYKDRKSKVIE